ncbi:MAG TPA: O-methyltransferase [Cryptosporangiaceae bacterium]|nr:O-methyltransferase [Cryptosporangiaceae bacterium]
MEGSGHSTGPAFADAYPAEDPVAAVARGRAAEVGCFSPSPGAGSVLRLLAAASLAKAVVEVGTGTGVSGLWLLGGMRPDGVLTSIDGEPEYQRMARAAFREAGVAPGRYRLINGRALDVLPRLADSSYDLVVVMDAPRAACPDYLAAALRLLRPGGVVAFAGVLADGRVTDPSARDEDAVAMRELLRIVHDHAHLVSAVIPVGDGLLAAATHT